MLLTRIVFASLTLIAFAGASVYVYRRAVRDTIESVPIRWVMRGLLALLFLAVPIVRFAFREQMPPMWLSAFVLTGWGVFIYLLISLMGIELVRWLATLRKVKNPAPVTPETPERRLFLSRLAASGALATSTGISAYGAWRAFTPPSVTEVPVKLPGLPKALDGFTIVQLSDIHVGAIIQERFLDHLVDTANGAKPDLIAITGDLVDGTPNALGRYVARLRNLRSRFGTFFCSGNHDYYSGWEDWARALEGIDFEVLRNRSVVIGDPGASFDLIGVEDWSSRGGPNGFDLEAATAGRDPERASVLMAHQPNGLDLVSKLKLGLQLSGHTHGGQLFPATVIGDVIWGSKNTGLSMHDGTQLYTSRGCGFVGPPMRVGAPPEVVKLILTA